MNTLSFGPLAFSVTNSRVEPVSDFSFSRSISYDLLNDSKKLPKVNLKRPEPWTLSVRVQLFRELGSDIDAQVKMVDSVILSGKDYVLTVGQIRSDTTCILTEWSEGNVTLSPSGRRLSTELTLKFMQYKANTSTASTKKTETKVEEAAVPATETTPVTATQTLDAYTSSGTKSRYEANGSSKILISEAIHA